MPGCNYNKYTWQCTCYMAMSATCEKCHNLFMI